MPIVTQPALIEWSDFSGGWSPDGLNASTTPDVLLDVLNLLPDPNTGSLQTRPGFRRHGSDDLDAGAGAALTTGHYIKQVGHFRTSSTNYFIAVCTDGSANADNVQLYAVNIDSPYTLLRMDTPGRTWSNSEAMFWFQGIDGVLYMGSKGNEMCSWDPSGPTWDATAATPTTKTWVDDTGAGVTTATEYGRDNAWTGKELVAYSGDIFMPMVNIKEKLWEDDTRYTKGEKVSVKLNSYWRSYKCYDDHTSAAGTKPDSGANWKDYWKRVKLDAPQDEDGNTNKDWAFIPAAAETSISMWFADRLWLRFDGQGDNSRAQYSAPVKPEKNEDIPNVLWDPTDWAPGNDFRGQGGGWVPFNDGKHDGAISAMRPFGQYGLVFKRKAVWVISGSDDTSWNVRKVARGAGAVGQQATVESDGLVYFLSDDGLHVTDGTVVEEVPGNEKVGDWIRTRLDGALAYEDTDGAQPTLFKWNGFIGISIPYATDSAPGVTLFYEPKAGSFWYTNLPVLDWQSYNDTGVAKAAFCMARNGASDSPRNIIYIFDKSNANDKDDAGGATYDTPSDAPVDIAWSMDTAWLAFSTARMERRIRRVWWLVKGAISMTIKQYRNYSATEATTTARTGPSAAGYIEGVWMADCHAMRMELSGASAPVSIYGYSADTEPRRVRYHTN